MLFKWGREGIMGVVAGQGGLIMGTLWHCFVGCGGLD